jgi:hypothetical protein
METVFPKIQFVPLAFAGGGRFPAQIRWQLALPLSRDPVKYPG